MSITIFKHLSIVIPVAPNDQSWRYLLLDLAAFGQELEIILAACQSQADDFKMPDNVRWLQSNQGRAQQLNAGAKQSTRDFIWFLHADTRLTTEVISTIQHYIKKDNKHLAYFRLKFADDGPIQTKLNAWAANIRSQYFGLPFGDQGFMLSRTLFVQLKGFNEHINLGEDLDFILRVRAAGGTLQALPASLITSARRYQQHGWLLTTARHIFLTCLLTHQAKKRLRLLA